MLSIRLKKRPNRKENSITTADYIKSHLCVDRGGYDTFTQAAKDYAVQSCMDNINSLNYGLDNKLISGKPYTMSELYEQAIYTERAFTAGVRWAIKYLKG